jgi:TonB family protein
MGNRAKVLCVALLTVNLLSGQTKEVSSDEAERHLVKRVKAVYPGMAQIAHILGEVTMRVTISEKGNVTDVQPVNGHPLLTAAAQTAIRQWRYAPFEFSGRRTSVATSVVISFPGGLPLTKEEREKAEQKAEQEEKLYQDLLSCTMRVATKRLAEAEPVCRRALASANALDPPDQMARMEAFKYVGQLLLFQGKAEAALQNYQEELFIAEKLAKDFQNEKFAEDFQNHLAQAHVNVGNAKRSLDDARDAAEHYEKAESIYRRIIKDPASDRKNTMQNSKAFALWQVLRSHAEVLRRMGQAAAAGALEREAAAITVEESAPR